MKTKDIFTNARYRKLIVFFASIFIHVIWWDLLLRRIPLIRAYLPVTAITRWQNIAQRFRVLAVENGRRIDKVRSIFEQFGLIFCP